MRKILIPLLFLSFLLVVPFLEIPLQANKIDQIGPIVIAGNSNFFTFAKKHGASGNGSSSSPLVISNLCFLSDKEPWCLVLEGVSLHVIFQNITVTEKHEGVGIELVGCSNITIKGSNANSTSTAIYLSYCRNISIISSKIIGGSSGVYCEDSKNVKIENCSVLSWIGVYILNSSNISLMGNKVYGNYSGVLLSYSENCNFMKNSIYRSWIGARLQYSQNCTFYANTFKNVTYIVDSTQSCKIYFYLNSFLKWKGPWINKDGVFFRSPGKCKYLFQNREFIGFLGNYWGTSGHSPTFKMKWKELLLDSYSLSAPPYTYKIIAFYSNYSSKGLSKKGEGFHGIPYVCLGAVLGASAVLVYLIIRRRSSQRSSSHRGKTPRKISPLFPLFPLDLHSKVFFLSI